MSDPCVRKMTEAQWHFEYHALRMKDRNMFDYVTSIFEAFFRSLRSSLVHILGLDLVKSWRHLGVSDPRTLEVLKNETPYVPLTQLVAHGERIDFWQQKDDGLTDEQAAQKEAEAEQFSLLLRSGALDSIIPPTRPEIKYTDTVEFKEAQQRLEEHTKLVQTRGRAEADPVPSITGLRSRKLMPGEQKPTLRGKI